MKDIPRYVLYAVVAILAVLLVQGWQKDYPPVRFSSQTSESVVPGEDKNATLGGFIPSVNKDIAEEPTGTARDHVKKIVKSVNPTTGQLVWAETNLLGVAIHLQTGTVVDAKLLKFPTSTQDKSTPVNLLTLQENHLYLAQSGIVSTKSQPPVSFQVKNTSYTLQPGQDSFDVVLKGKTNEGLYVEKTFTFKRNEYAIGMKTAIWNRGKKSWEGSLYTQIVRQPPSEKSEGLFGMHYYLGASTSSPQTPYEKVSFKDMEKQALNRTVVGGWVAMQQHYFLSAWVPQDQKQHHHVYTHYESQNGDSPATYTIGYLSPLLKVAAGQTTMNNATLYLGPESYSRLKELAPGLDHTIDYGVLWPISIAIQWIMTLFVKVIPNWGVAIILATILIKLLFYGFSSKSFISMAKMKELQPRIKALKERFGEDRAGLQKATMALYKEKKVNPLGGCLPMLIQIPVFIALYWVITQSVDFRQAPFVFWIQDLSVPDPYYVLPIVMMFTMILQQWLSPTSADPAQAKMMLIMPILFAFFFRNFPAGLVLYWCVNNLVQALQQGYVMKRYKAGKYRDNDRKKKHSRA